jgi:serine/threonine protein kinase
VYSSHPLGHAHFPAASPPRRLWEIIYAPERIYLVMEFAARGELFQYIVKCGRVREDEGRRFFQQIVSGLAYLHQQHVVHRDIKPENLLLDRCGRADCGPPNWRGGGTAIAFPKPAACGQTAASLGPHPTWRHAAMGGPRRTTARATARPLTSAHARCATVAAQ